MIVLGVDVGLRTLGYVFCKLEGLEVGLVKEGEVKPDPQKELPEKLDYIFRELSCKVYQYQPKAIVAEKLYSHYRHPTTLGVLAEVRGVVALLSHQQGIDFFEYAPTRARKSFLGRGHANSRQVQRMAENITGRSFLSEHTADAFSLVVAFSHAQKVERILQKSF